MRHFQAGNAPARISHKSSAGSRGFGQEAVEAEGHGPGAYGLGPVADLASWRYGHGPVPRDYSYKLPREDDAGGVASALSAKVRDGELKVVQAFKLADHKTKTR